MSSNWQTFAAKPPALAPLGDYNAVLFRLLSQGRGASVKLTGICGGHSFFSRARPGVILHFARSASLWGQASSNEPSGKMEWLTKHLVR
jgi:hypothetical protein